MRRGGGEGVLLIFEAIGDSCGEAPIFLYPALGNLHIDLQLPIGLVTLVISRGSLVP